MTIIYLAEHNFKCYGVTFQNNGCVKLQKFKDISNDENNILYIEPLQTLIGKSHVCDLIDFSGACDREVFNGITVLLKVGDACGQHKLIYIGGVMVCSFLTLGFIYKYISNMGNNLTPYSIAIGIENIYFLTPHFKLLIKKT